MAPSQRLIVLAAAATLAACQPAAAPAEPAPVEAPVATTSPPAPAPTPAPTPAGPVTYTCDNGKTLVATYTGENASVVYDGKTHAMTTVISADGARYQGDGLQWWTKGMTEGMVAPLPPGETDPAPGTEVACRAPAAPASTA
ncbi:MliC family protein [Brevundimonas lenta]|uniref:Membrane-bound inhibitor of C-type lysozyme n=1 Tax=Brevundimonas lenta TaxID=424796 RepID=A0A7W6NNC4_9CAUL|nr:MliC family protein [Brevundimonas lenta]MBB4081648.1 membrane-bound inhibitor of C-type lysozyme [Brevundimonas lenta]